MPSYHIQRTESELQLFEDMAVAEYRDRCMFNRLVNGIRQRQQVHYETQRHQLYQVSEPTTANATLSLPPRPRRRITPATSNNAFMRETDRTIENIISTRCQSTRPVEAMGRSNTRPQPSNHRLTTRDISSSDDWTIEGYDDDDKTLSPRLHVNIIPDDLGSGNNLSDDHNDQLFDMDL